VISVLNKPFLLNVEFTKLVYSEVIEKIDIHEIDKSATIEIKFGEV